MKSEFTVFISAIIIICFAGMLVDMLHGGHFRPTLPPSKRRKKEGPK
jgi:hypothetical protein